jgi:hypothetical protein
MIRNEEKIKDYRTFIVACEGKIKILNEKIDMALNSICDLEQRIVDESQGYPGGQTIMADEKNWPLSSIPIWKEFNIVSMSIINLNVDGNKCDIKVGYTQWDCDEIAYEKIYDVNTSLVKLMVDNGDNKVIIEKILMS